MNIEYVVPQKFEKVLKNDNYKRNTKYSVTELNKSIRAVILSKRYSDKVEFDVEDRLWSFFGSAFHTAMEDAETKNDLAEIRLKYKELSGKFDHYDGETQTLYDFKFTSVWSMVFMDEQNAKEKQTQLSVYAWLLENAGFKVKSIKNIFIFRDWKKSEYNFGKYNVSKPYATVEYEILKEIDGLPIQEWIDKKIEEFEKYDNLEDEKLPECSEEYRWAKPTKYAVMKNTNKTATRIFENKEEAEKFIEENTTAKNVFKIEERAGNKFVRCEYCDIHEFCSQYKHE